MKILLLVSVLLFSSLILLSCKKNNPVPPEERPQISLSLEDVSCTEAWMKLSTSNIALPANVELLKDDSLNRTVNLTTADTVLYIDSLLPNQTYSFHTIIQPYNHTDEVASAPISVTTMDTTSHNFTWQTYSFGGQAGSCTLYDVTIINENNIWAVGEIYLLDTLGQPDPQAYSVAIWDGQSWRLNKLFYNTNIPVTPKGILVLNSSEIYLASGSIFRWDGTSSTVQMVYSRLNLPNPNGTIVKLWGNSELLYGVGNAGTIVSYRNGQWSRIESGTDLNINDIWGDYNTLTSEREILAVGGDEFIGTERIILQILTNNQVNEINPAGTESYPLSCIWFKNKWKFYTGGAGLYSKNYGNGEWKQIPLPNYYTYSIRGTGLNDIIICGGLGYIGHFNGSSWINYLGNGLEEIDGNYYSVAIQGNTVCAVGAKADQKAIALIGIRE